jgi:hypothetical protein
MDFSTPNQFLATVRRWTTLASIAATCTLAACSHVPDLPSESDVPVQLIIENAVCELKDTFEALSDKHAYPGFKAAEWAASIVLTPKVDTSAVASFGFTGRNTTLASAPILWSWIAAPAASYDERGRNDASATYVVSSGQLLAPKAAALSACSKEHGSHKAMTHHLGILEWWQRVIPAKDGIHAAVTKLDKTAFTQQIIVKLGAGVASATYTVVPRTYTGSLSGAYTRDLTLSIAFTPDPKKTKVNTLPMGGIESKGPPAAVESVSPDALNRLNSIQQDNILRNLRIQAQ